MSKVLVTGFDPFGGESVNPAFEAVRLLPDEIAGAEVVKLEIPTSFARSAKAVEAAIERERPDVVLCVGQAGGRASIGAERVAINLAEARIPDNDGEQPFDTPLRTDGPTAFFSTLPVKAMVLRAQERGVPAFVSYTAGTFVCNAVMYNLLYLLERRFPGVRGGFVHVPYAAEQAMGKPADTPTMSLETIARGLEAMIEAAVTEGVDAAVSMGETE